MKLHSLIAIICIGFCVVSCTQNNSESSSKPQNSRVVLPPNTGNLSELVVVISDELWEGEVGGIIKSVFQESVPAIPQQEALFDIYAIESRDFSSIFQTHKNILWVSTGENSLLEEKHQKWAKRQLFVNVSAETEEQLAEKLKKDIYKIRHWFLNKDQERRLRKLKMKSEKKLAKELLNSYGVKMVLPEGYHFAEAEDNFVWLRRDNPSTNIISNLWIHTEDYYSEDQLGKERLIQLRDSLGRVHVEGSRPQSYMATEMMYDPDYSLKSENPYIIETKGLWTMVNDFLGGSYIANVILDTENQKLIYAEGFLYCPSERKRTHIHELDAILSSIEFK